MIRVTDEAWGQYGQVLGDLVSYMKPIALLEIPVEQLLD